MICTDSQENYAILNYCVLNVTVCERCLRSSTVSSVSVCHCFYVQPWTDTMYFEWFSSYTNTITLMSWFIFFIFYVFALYYIVCMYPLYTTCALLLLSIVWLKYVFPCVLLVDNYVSLNQCDLNFHFLKRDLDDLYGEVDVFIWLYWFLHLTLICIDDIYDKY